MGKRHEDEHCLAEYLVPLVLGHVFYGAAVVESVGQLDEDDTDIVIEGKEDALEILGLDALCSGSAAFFLIFKHILDFGQAVDEGGNLVPEKIPDVFRGVGGVFHDIVQKCSGDGLAAKAYVSDHDSGDRYRMENIWLPGTPADILVGFIGKLECLLDYLKLIFSGTSLAGGLLEVRIASRDDLVVLLCEFRRSHLILSQCYSCSRSGTHRIVPPR